MSGKSRVSQRQRRPSGQAQPQPGTQRPGPNTARQKDAADAHERRARLTAARETQRRAQRRRRIAVPAGIAAGIAAVIAVLFVIFQNSSSPSSSAAGAYPYQVGSPASGQTAPGFSLAASTGGTISLSQFRGKTVLLFFQEGLTCQPCWDQITDLQQHAAQLKATGIDQVISVTSDPIGAITTKTRDMGLTIPVLSDPNLAVSQQYQANRYGMMGASRDGHTFIEVGPDGKIEWRADYGGAPKYTMFLPTASLLADIKAGEHPSS